MVFSLPAIGQVEERELHISPGELICHEIGKCNHKRMGELLYKTTLLFHQKPLPSLFESPLLKLVLRLRLLP
ncbi:hypothetical protein HID58_065652 [Brassica napus]|uniref:BnaCnng65770D protein n=2 Tax=Brassica napus TaxID=3708 RepID=A0A078JQM8_BRANA|nr:hypothetical protein HID58_065652 [Brassica napus]CAF1927722.1 unnamed protein product [Brassica napus]CDY69883.1 BnaCnng65770D [Brassica napus]